MPTGNTVHTESLSPEKVVGLVSLVEGDAPGSVDRNLESLTSTPGSNLP